MVWSNLKRFFFARSRLEYKKFWLAKAWSKKLKARSSLGSKIFWLGSAWKKQAPPTSSKNMPYHGMKFSSNKHYWIGNDYHCISKLWVLNLTSASLHIYLLSFTISASVFSRHIKLYLYNAKINQASRNPKIQTYWLWRVVFRSVVLRPSLYWIFIAINCKKIDFLGFYLFAIRIWLIEILQYCNKFVEKMQ